MTKHQEANKNQGGNWQKLNTYVFNPPGAPQKVKDGGEQGKADNGKPADV